MNISQVLEKTCLGILVPIGEDSPLPLEHTAVAVQVIGPISTVAVTQHYTNPFDTSVELEYLFPLPHTAAIVDFELRIGQRIIQGDLQEVEQARQAYEKAREEGKKAGFFEERRPNLFAIQIANVLPGESLKATMRYQERLPYDNGSYSFIFPMGLTPRYHSPGEPSGQPGVDAPIAASGEHIGSIEINLAVDAGVSCGDPSSPSHKLEFTRLDERRFSLKLAEKTIPDHDFVMRYPVAPDQVSLAAWRSKGKDADYFMASLLPPVLEGEVPEPPARDFIFVLDRSGSMMGEPIAQARNALRACLRMLNPQDCFSLLLFDDRLEWYAQKPVVVSQAEVEKADTFLSQVEGRGGTEIVAALQASLSRPSDKNYQKTIVFLTDGAVSAEEQAFDQVRKKLGGARLFTFGIGPSVNRALLSRLAELGGGAVEFLQLNEDIEEAILRFQDRLSFPVLTDLSLSFDNGKAWDIYPFRLPDLFINQPLEIAGRFTPAESGVAGLTVSGQRGTEKITLQLTLGDENRNEPAIARTWGRARIDDLMEASATGSKPAHQVREEVIGLALELRLVTPYTAFVAIDSQPAQPETAKGGPLRTIHVSQPLPAGLDLEGFWGTGSMQPPASVPMAALSLPYPMALQEPDDQSPFVIKDLSTSPKKLFHSKAPGQVKPEKLISKAKTDSEIRSLSASTDDVLHWLVRNQKMDGSWNNDIELTAVALLVFLRAGFTTRVGYYRRPIQKAVDWLIKAQPSGVEAFSRAVTMLELARITGNAGYQQKADEAIADLPNPSSTAEKLLISYLQSPEEPKPAVTAIRNLEDLRLAVWLGLKLQVTEELLKNDFEWVCAACIRPDGSS